MQPSEIGIVYNELRTKKVLFSGAIIGRRRSDGELEAIRIIREQNGRLEDLYEFLETQGLQLKVIDVMPLGIGGEGSAYLLLRLPGREVPDHVAGDQLISLIADARRDETAEQTAVWATFLTIILLHLMYTRDERPIEAISVFKDVAIVQEDLVEIAARRIEALRGAPKPASERQRMIRETLITGSERSIESRVRGFLSAMTQLGVLERLETQAGGRVEKAEPFYRQTLWSAVDLAENFRRYAPHLVVERDEEAIEALGTDIDPVLLGAGEIEGRDPRADVEVADNAAAEPAGDDSSGSSGGRSGFEERDIWGT